jgi:hypothetical protein
VKTAAAWTNCSESRYKAALHTTRSVTPYIHNMYQGVPYLANITRCHICNSIY